MPVFRLEMEARPGLTDALAEETRERLEDWLDLRPARVRTRKVYHLDLDIDEGEARRVADALIDPVAEVGTVGMLADEEDDGCPPWLLAVGLLPGVTDSVGKSVHRAAEDCLGRRLHGQVYASTLYMLWGLSRAEVERAANDLLHNPLIQRTRLEQPPRDLDLDVPRAGSAQAPEVASVPLSEADADELERLSRDGLLALTLEEMRAMQAHFRELGRDPTDAELECLAQTWSEHCKHKIFAAPIEYTDPAGETATIEDGLFATYIRGATEAIADARGDDFLVSVFHDNAGVVRFTDADHLVYKVETHNSPSALDPYGGAMTGIVGVNRDSFGTGLGADMLTNVWGYCFGDPRWEGSLPRGLMHPRRIRDGVHRGVIDGGNQSGIPYSRGFELFDERYLGKPLVYCGTAAVMPVERSRRPTHRKRTAVGDRVVMVGGRIGKDGIHGATFSSAELDESSPVQAVQIGDPITQKMMFDMLTEARDAGLITGLTDNGAGGLSSSVGEMAEATGGARIDLAKAPLKYPGLAPWEILISEAQERMTVAVPPVRLDEFMELARRREVEATVLGEFTDSGRFEVTYGDLDVVDLSLEFLHHGLPRALFRATWSPPDRTPADPAALGGDTDVEALLLDLLAAPNLASHEDRARRYDHEVKGLSVVKPLVGVRRDVPSVATVMRGRHRRPEGVVLAEGIHPFYGDIDTHAMAAACVDEGVRRVLCAGARIDRLCALDNFCWPDPIRSEKTPDGEHKLAQLVRCCQGLRQACEAFGVPLISGKDSMKNDAYLGGVKISIPPTLLVSVMGQMEDVARALTLVPRQAGDLVFALGPTREELGGSQLARLQGAWLDTVPRTDLAANAARYAAFVEARDAGLVRSAHVTSRGGLAVALAHMVMASGLVLDCDIAEASGGLGATSLLFSESTGRIVLTCTPADRPALEKVLAPHGLARLGRVAEASEDGGRLSVRGGGKLLVDVSDARLRERFKEGLGGL